MSNEELEIQLGELVQTERRTTNEILQLILEAENRRLPLIRGHASTQAWLTDVYRYSESAAYRRIQAARLLKVVPEIEMKIAEGVLNLTTLALAQSTIQREEKRTGRKINRKEVISKIEGQSSKKTERTLAREFPELSFKKDSLRAISETESRLNVVIDEETRELLETARSQLSHAVPDGSANEILKRALKKFVKQGDTGAKTKVGKRCEWMDPITRKRCNSTYQLQIDHIIPKAKGGTDEPKNLRFLCRQHNLLEAECVFGRKAMDRYRAHN